VLRKIELKIYGKVQGVFFRDSAKREAKKLGLFGFVRNEPDGTVYIVAEGEDEKLKEFIKWGEKGTNYAKVEKINIEYKKPTDEFSSFEIK